MKTQIKKIGNSKGIIIPAAIIKTLGLEEQDSLLLEVQGDSIIIKKEKKTPMTLMQLFEEYDGNYDYDIVFDDAVGDEVW
ncbi:MAG: AbrB/MazE/SpoVT family DNA-binding domain-containing protein [Acholeplasmataceae bacterium]|jgi:antitoxin MazE